MLAQHLLWSLDKQLAQAAFTPTTLHNLEDVIIKTILAASPTQPNPRYIGSDLQWHHRIAFDRNTN